METQYIGDTLPEHNGKSSEPPYQEAKLTKPPEDPQESLLEFFTRSPKWEP